MLRFSSHRLLICALVGTVALALASLVGCGPTPEPMHPVEGKIQFEGKPLTTGTVILHPDAGKNNVTKHEPRSAIEADGRFKIYTHPREGAPPGWYKVAVIVTEPSDKNNPYSIPRSLIPEKFGKLEESNLRIEVRKDAPPGAYDLDLK